MLRFVLTYRTAIDKITADKALKLRKYELDNDDWGVIEDLVCVLEVSLSSYLPNVHANDSSNCIALQESYPFLLERYCQHCSSDTCHGQARQSPQPSNEDAVSSRNPGGDEARP
jgi:hypothetical protein